MIAIPAKSNMMASNNNPIWMICNDKCETQKHLLAECKQINLEKKIEYKKAFNNNDIEAQKNSGKKNKTNHRPPREDPKCKSSPTGWATRRSGPMRHYYYHEWGTTQRREWILDESRNRFCTISATDSWQRTREHDECVHKMTNIIHNYRCVKPYIIHNIA